MFVLRTPNPRPLCFPPVASVLILSRFGTKKSLTTVYRYDNIPHVTSTANPSSTPPRQANPFAVIFLQPLGPLFSAPVLWNQSLAASFRRTPGWGVHRYPSGLFCTRHRMRHAAPLSPLVSTSCAYFPSPRGVCPLPLQSRHIGARFRRLP